MSSLCFRSALVLIAGAVVGLASAQVTFTIPGSTTVGFGSEALIVSDVNGGGRLDVVVSTVDPTLGASAIDIMSSETGASLSSFVVGGDFGRALANVGNIDGIPGDEFMVSFPAGGVLFTFQGTVPLTPIGSGFNVGQAVTVMTTLADLDGDGGAEVALGEPQANQVQVMNAITGVILFTITDPRNGGFGSSLATAGNRLAVGAPNWSNIVGPPPGPPLGYVDVFKLNSTSATLGATFAAPGSTAVAHRFGNSLAAIGDLDGDSQSEYAIQSPSSAARIHVFSEISPGAPLSTFNYTPTQPSGGRTASLGDINGDGRGDFAMSDGTSLFLFATPTNTTLSLLATIPPLAAGPFSGCVVSGPDLFKQGPTLGLRSLITGQVPAGGAGSARNEPVAMLRNLPNPPDLKITAVAANPRPIAGSNYPIRVETTSTTPVLAVLMVDFAPAKNIPAGNGIAFVGIGTSAVTLGFAGVVSGSPVTFNNVTLPSVAFVGNGLVFQAGGQTSQNTLLASNGLLTLLGTN